MERAGRSSGGVPERSPAVPVRPPPEPAVPVRPPPEPSGPVRSSLRVGELARLQRVAGNREVTRLLRAAGGRPVQRWDGPEHVELGNTSRGPQPGRILLDAHSAD